MLNTEIMDEAVRAMISDGAHVASELKKFKRTAKLFSSNTEQLLEKFENRWIAAYDGSILTDAANLNKLIEKIDRLGIPRRGVLVRFIERDTQKLILNADRSLR